MAKKSESADMDALQNILESLVTYPEDVNIERKVDEMGVLLSVKVNSKDMGILIGRNGIMASSIKVIMKAVGKSNDMNVRVQFLEPDGSLRYSKKKPQQEKNTKSESKAKNKEEPLSEEKVEEEAGKLDDELEEFVID